MHSSKVTGTIKTLTELHKLTQTGIIFWNSLILPALTAIFVTHLLEVNKNTSESLSILVMILVFVVIVIHVGVIYLQYRGSNINTLLIEYQEKDRSLNDIAGEFKELSKCYSADTMSFSSQRTATRFAVNSLSYSVGKIRNIEITKKTISTEDAQEMLHDLIWPLVVYREKLFSYSSGSLWNIALYAINSSNELEVIWRMNDERIKPRNRSWKVGFGVVGLAYLHKIIKYHPDISKATLGYLSSRKDLETYKSIIAIPVIPCEDSSSNDEHSPSGVLLLTSSVEEQFNLDRDAAFLQTYANLISILVDKVNSHIEHAETK